jgi:hypothetical protein
MFESNKPSFLALTEAQAKKELALEEECWLAGGGSALHTTSASGFVIMALEIEETQCVFSPCKSTIPMRF